jgi:hypothetical protein
MEAVKTMFDADQCGSVHAARKFNMSINIIDILARGDQELFHSAFLAWLMKDRASHGLGKAFRARILSNVRQEFGYDPNGDYKVDTEVCVGRLRFDILLQPIGASKQRSKGLVFENKFKAFGKRGQVDDYKDAGYDVVFFALLPETLTDDIEPDYQVIRYAVFKYSMYRILRALASKRRTGGLGGRAVGFLVKEIESARFGA